MGNGAIVGRINDIACSHSVVQRGLQRILHRLRDGGIVQEGSRQADRNGILQMTDTGCADGLALKDGMAAAGKDGYHRNDRIFGRS